MDEKPIVIKDQGVPPIVLKKPGSNKEAQKPVKSNFVDKVPPETERLFSDGKDQKQTVSDLAKGFLSRAEKLASEVGAEKSTVPDPDFVKKALSDVL